MKKLILLFLITILCSSFILAEGYTFNNNNGKLTFEMNGNSFDLQLHINGNKIPEYNLEVYDNGNVLLNNVEQNFVDGVQYGWNLTNQKDKNNAKDKLWVKISSDDVELIQKDDLTLEYIDEIIDYCPSDFILLEYKSGNYYSEDCYNEIWKQISFHDLAEKNPEADIKLKENGNYWRLDCNGCEDLDPLIFDDFLPITSGVFNNTAYSVSENAIILTSNETLQELPSNMDIEEWYGGVNMTGNILLYHLNNDSAFGESSTNNNAGIYDFSGNSNNGTIQLNAESDMTFEDGKLGNSAYFDGVDDYIEFDSTDFSSLNEGTIMAWVNNLGTSSAAIISFSDSGDSASYFGLLYPKSSSEDVYTFGIYSKNENILQFNADLKYYLSPNTWYHIAYSSDTDGNKFYIDGKQVAMTYSVGSSTDNYFISNVSDVDVARIGGALSSGGALWQYDGNIDEVSVWNRSLNENEVFNIFQRQKGVYINRGEYLSNITNFGESKTVATVEWETFIPLDLQLPDNEEVETGGVDMTDNVALYHLNEVSGNLADSSGNSHTMTPEGDGMTYSSVGMINSSIDFISDEFYVADNSDFDMTTEMTLEAWIKPADYGYRLGTMSSYVKDSFEIDNAFGGGAGLIDMGDNYYIVPYHANTNKGNIKIIKVDDSGFIQDISESYMFDATESWETTGIKVNDNIFAVVYRGVGYDGFIKTLNYSNGKVLNTIDSYEFETTNMYEPEIINISSTMYAISFKDEQNDGKLETVSIDAEGDIGTVVQTLEFDTADSISANFVYHTNEIYVGTWEGTGEDGFVNTVEILSNGSMSVIETWEFDATRGDTPDIIKIDGNIFAVISSNSGYDGSIDTFEVLVNGSITKSVIATSTITTDGGLYFYVTKVYDNIFGISAQGDGSDSFVNIYSISNDGATISRTDKVETNPVAGTPRRMYSTGGIVHLLESDTNSDLWYKTIEVDDGGSIESGIEDTVEIGENTNSNWNAPVNARENIVAVYYVNDTGATSTIKTYNISDGEISAELDSINVKVGEYDDYGYDIFYLSEGFIGVFDSTDDDIQTYSVDENGNLALLDTLAFSDTMSDYYSDVKQVDADTWAMCYSHYNSYDGWLVTFEMNDSGWLGSEIEKYEFDTTYQWDCSMDFVYDNILAVAYRGVDADGWLKTMEVLDNGSISAVIDSLEFDTADIDAPSVQSFYNGQLTIAYSNSGYDGQITNVLINNDGTIEEEYTDFEFSGNNDYADPNIFQIADNIFGVIGRNAFGFDHAHIYTFYATEDGGIVSINNYFLQNYDDLGRESINIAKIDDNLFAYTWSDGGLDMHLGVIEIFSNNNIKKTDSYGITASQSGAYGFLNDNVLGSSNIDRSGWNHVALTYNGSQGFLYVNGIEEDQINTTETLNQNSNSFFIGDVFTGQNDEVALFSRALTSAEILEHYERGAMRINMSYRFCSDATCSGNEEFLNSTQNSPLTIEQTGQYFQFKGMLDSETDDYTPKLVNATIGYYGGNITRHNVTTVNGGIRFIEDIEQGLPTIQQLNSAITIEQHKIKVDSDTYPQLNRRAELTFSNVTWENTVVQRNGVLCEDCVVTCANNNCTTEVSSFSEYEIVETNFTNGTHYNTTLYNGQLGLGGLATRIYHFQESDGTLVDSSVYGENVTIYNSPTQVSGKFGFAREFNGVNQFAITGANAVAENGTIMFWAKVNSTDGNVRIFSTEDSDGSNSEIRTYSSGMNKLSFYLANGTGVNFGSWQHEIDGLSIANWNHYVATWVYNSVTDITTCNLYANSVLDDTFTIGGFQPSGDVSSSIGRWNYDKYFNGTVDEFYILETPLTQSQIEEVYNASVYSAIVEDDSFLVNYKFDDGNTENATDYSTGGYIGTLQNGVGYVDDGKHGKALLCNESESHYVDISNNSDFDMGNFTDFSISVWINTNDSAGQIISHTNGASPQWKLEMQGEEPRFVSGDGTDATYTHAITDIYDSTWHHIAVTVNRTGSARIYIDGIEEDSDSLSAIDNITSGGDITICRLGTHSSNYLNAMLDDLQIYVGQVLTPEEVLRLASSYDNEYLRNYEGGRYESQEFDATFDSTWEYNVSNTTNISSGEGLTGTCGSLDSASWETGTQTDINFAFTGEGQCFQYGLALVGDGYTNYLYNNVTVLATEVVEEETPAGGSSSSSSGGGDGEGLMICPEGQYLGIDNYCYAEEEEEEISEYVTGVWNWFANLGVGFLQALGIIPENSTITVSEEQIAETVNKITESVQEAKTSVNFWIFVGLLLGGLLLVHYGYVPYWAMLIIPVLYWIITRFT